MSYLKCFANMKYKTCDKAFGTKCRASNMGIAVFCMMEKGHLVNIPICNRYACSVCTRKWLPGSIKVQASLELAGLEYFEPSPTFNLMDRVGIRQFSL